MRTYWMDDKRNFVCVVDYKGHSGSIRYSFIDGLCEANKPDNMMNILWFWYMIEFFKICIKMVKPAPKLIDGLD